LHHGRTTTTKKTRRAAHEGRNPMPKHPRRRTLLALTLVAATLAAPLAAHA